MQAAVTRTGVLTYDAKTLGLKDRTGPVRVLRTPESVFHEKTLESIRDSVVTLHHPPGNQVNPDNWRDVAVGNITGTPAALDSERVGAGFIIRDRGAIAALENGTKEVSIGYDMNLVPVFSTEYDYRTDGPMLVNHIAMEDKGRAGPEIRVFDKEDSDDMPDGLSEEMAKNISETVKAAVADAMPKQEPGSKEAPQQQQIDPEKLATSILTGMKPALDAMDKIAETVAAQEQARIASEAEAKAKDAADALVNTTLETERARVATLEEARPFIAADAFEKVKEAAPKDILVAAVGASVQDAADKSEDFLRGVLAGMAKDRQNVADFRQSTGYVGDAIRNNDAYNNYIKSLNEGYKQPLNTAG